MAIRLTCVRDMICVSHSLVSLPVTCVFSAQLSVILQGVEARAQEREFLKMQVEILKSSRSAQFAMCMWQVADFETFCRITAKLMMRALWMVRLGTRTSIEGMGMLMFVHGMCMCVRVYVCMCICMCVYA
jgi:ribosomal protein L20